jgi:hypothetical protein
MAMLQTVVETATFIRPAEKLLSSEEHVALRDMPIYALVLYGKCEQADLTSDERKSVAAFAAAIKATRKRG